MVQKLSFTLALVAGICFSAVSQKKFTPKQIEALKAEVSTIVEANHKQSQVMVDKVFSFAELGFQEVQSSKYLSGILEKQGFKI
jgi:aminobenzoyl-glutamate utilization protein B